MKSLKLILLALLGAHFPCLATLSDTYSPQLITLSDWDRKEKATIPAESVSLCGGACSDLKGCQVFQFILDSGECVLATFYRGPLVKVWFYIPGLDLADYVKVFVNYLSFVGKLNNG